MAVNTELHPTLENLDPKLVFARFGDLARKRESLYSDFIEIDEPEEIGNAWVSFSSVVVNDLLSVINLTKSLFERLVDELRRSNEEPEPSDLNRIQKLTEFWLDLSVIAYLYATVEKRGVLNQPGTGTNSLGYIEAKKSIDQLILLAFQAGQEFFSIDARITLGEVLALDQEKKRLDYLEILSEEENDMKNKILGSYDYNQTRFLMTRLQKRMINSALSWWWSDAISMHSLAEHALSHLDSCKNYWSKCSSDLFEKGLVFHQQQFPIIKIYSSVSLAQHFRRLGLAALKVRGNAVASEYFYQAAELTASMGMENLGIVEKIELWEPSIPEQYLIYTQMSYLSTISSKYHSILRYIKDNKIDEIKILVPEILENISRILSFGDLAYV
ncbi:MAG: hypothetical protein OEZ01_07505, partial [Candidatus Heimdallarchaeota archaeon]|nr:hypothetical protein [Candidatus Heimdallarchaeota archaeon]